MRWFYWASAMVILLSVETAFAACSSCNGTDVGSFQAYRGAACFCPPGFGLAPGCCQCPPSACDNAWEGYCQEKARWQAFFYTVGVPKPHCYCPSLIPVLPRSQCCPALEEEIEAQPTSTDKSTAPQPMPTPTPASSKATWRLPNPWYR